MGRDTAAAIDDALEEDHDEAPPGALVLGKGRHLLAPLAPSSAHLFATFSGTGFGGLRTTSTLKPDTSSAHPRQTSKTSWCS
jgi:hypothetical protein